MTLRSLVFWPHLIAGVVAGAVILLMSVTGVLLTYERQLIAWSDSHYVSTPPQTGAARLSVEELLARVRQARPDLAPTAVTVASEPTEPVMLAVPQRVIYADAYSGAVLGEGTRTVRELMADLRAWHRWIAVEGEGRPLARAITGWSNFIFLFIVASGFYLWFPRKWTWPHVRQVTLFRGGLRGKARDFNWHNVIGLWSAVPLFLIVLGALPISFPWANAAVYRIVGEEPPAARGGGPAPQAAAPRAGGPGQQDAPAGRAGGPGQAAAGPVRGAGAATPPGEGRRSGRRGGSDEPAPLDGLNALMARAEAQVPEWRTINMRVPANLRAPVVFAIDAGDGGQPQLRSTLTLERATGAVEEYEAFADQSLGRRLRSIARFGHTGEVLGLTGQTIAGLATAGAVVLVWTGIALALRRFRGWISRRGGRPAVADESRRTEAA